MAIMASAGAVPPAPQDLSPQHSQALALYQAGHLAEASEVERRAVDEAARRFPADSLELAMAKGNLGALYIAQEKPELGSPLLEEARAIRAKHGVTGNYLGVETEVLFDQMAKGRRPEHLLYAIPLLLVFLIYYRIRKCKTAR